LSPYGTGCFSISFDDIPFISVGWNCPTKMLLCEYALNIILIPEKSVKNDTSYEKTAEILGI